LRGARGVPSPLGSRRATSPRSCPSCSGGRSAPAGGGLEPDQGAGQRGRRPSVVDCLLGASSRQAALGPLPGARGAPAVDLLGPLGRVGKNDDLVVPDLREATRQG